MVSKTRKGLLLVESEGLTLMGVIAVIDFLL